MSGTPASYDIWADRERLKLPENPTIASGVAPNFDANQTEVSSSLFC